MGNVCWYSPILNYRPVFLLPQKESASCTEQQYQLRVTPQVFLIKAPNLDIHLTGTNSNYATIRSTKSIIYKAEFWKNKALCFSQYGYMAGPYSRAILLAQPHWCARVEKVAIFPWPHTKDSFLRRKYTCPWLFGNDSWRLGYKNSESSPSFVSHTLVAEISRPQWKYFCNN